MTTSVIFRGGRFTEEKAVLTSTGLPSMIMVVIGSGRGGDGGGTCWGGGGGGC
ncbi:MAG TPA: hypothetical protein VFV78_10130 [Vicinamibacterales bacterium]|nr:hypothetical protein [Vicinamibacterales bacterium]